MTINDTTNGCDALCKNVAPAGEESISAEYMNVTKTDVLSGKGLKRVLLKYRVGTYQDKTVETAADIEGDLVVEGSDGNGQITTQTQTKEEEKKMKIIRRDDKGFERFEDYFSSDEDEQDVSVKSPIPTNNSKEKMETDYAHDESVEIVDHIQKKDSVVSPATAVKSLKVGDVGSEIKNVATNTGTTQAAVATRSTAPSPLPDTAYPVTDNSRPQENNTCSTNNEVNSESSTPSSSHVLSGKQETKNVANRDNVLNDIETIEDIRMFILDTGSTSSNGVQSNGKTETDGLTSAEAGESEAEMDETEVNDSNDTEQLPQVKSSSVVTTATCASIQKDDDNVSVVSTRGSRGLRRATLSAQRKSEGSTDTSSIATGATRYSTRLSARGSTFSSKSPPSASVVSHPPTRRGQQKNVSSLKRKASSAKAVREESENEATNIKRVNDVEDSAQLVTNGNEQTSSELPSEQAAVPPSEQEVVVECFAPYQDVRWVRIGKERDMCKACDVQYARSLRPPFHLVSFLKLRPFASKGTSSTDKNTMVFVVLEGEVMVVLHKTEFVARKGDTFYVPPKNYYKLMNKTARRVELTLIQYQYDGPMTSVPAMSQSGLPPAEVAESSSDGESRKATKRGSRNSDRRSQAATVQENE